MSGCICGTPGLDYAGPTEDCGVHGKTGRDAEMAQVYAARDAAEDRARAEKARADVASDRERIAWGLVDALEAKIERATRLVTAPYYSDGSVTLYHGDALDVLPTLAAATYRAVLLDPPYSMTPNAVRGRDDGAAGTSGAPMRLLSESAAHARRLLAPGGVAAFVCDWRRVPDVSYLVTLTGLRLATCVAWTRTTVGTGGLFRTAWDPILIASNGSPEAIDRAGIPNVVTANPPTARTHPYEKPVALWRHILDRLPAGTVLDPFAGSGASGEAALLAGRPWVGVEIDEAHCERTARRLALCAPNLPGALDEIPTTTTEP